MTRPAAATAKVQVVGDVGPKFATDLAHDLNKAVRGVKLDTSPIADGITDGAKKGAAGAERALNVMTDHLGNVFAEIGHDADRAFDEVGDDAVAAAGKAERAFTGLQRDARGRFLSVGAAAGAAGDKVGHEFATAGEVSERSLRELARRAGLVFAQISNQAGAAATSMSAKFVAAWSVIKGALLAASTAAVAGLTAITVFGLKSAAALEQTAIGLEALLGSADAAKSFIADLQKFAAATPFEFADVADAAKRILAFGTSVGIARKQVIPTLTTIGDLVSVLGGTTENINSVIRALGQMASKGKVSQEEILQLAEALPGFNANAAIASSLGLSVADTLELITAGGVSAKVGIDALLKGMGQFPGAAGAMAKQAQTLNGVFSTFKDTIAIALTDAFAPVIPDIKDALAEITPVIGQAVKILAPALGEFLVKMLPLISGLVAALSPLLGVFTDLAGTILTALSPGLLALGGVATRLVEALAPLAVAIGEFLGKAIEELVKSGALDEIVEQLAAMAPALIELLVNLLPILPPLFQLLTLVLKMQTPLIQLLALLVKLAATPSPGFVRDFAESVAGLLDVIEPAVDFFSDIRNWPIFFDKLGEALSKVFADAWEHVTEFFVGVGHFFSELPGKIGSFLSSLPRVILHAIEKAMGAALDAVTHGIGLLIGAFLAFPVLVAKAIGHLPEVLAGIWSAITSAASAAWAAVVAFVPAALDRIGTALGELPGIVIGAFVSAFAAARQIVFDQLVAIGNLVGSLPGRIGALIPQMIAAGRNLIAGLFSGLSQAGGFVGDLASKIASSIKGLLNRVIGGINSGIASIDDALPGISLPRIPQLATGGLTTGAGLAQIHPRELVLPLEDRRVIDLLARAMSTAATSRAPGTADRVGAGTPEFDVRVFIGDTELKGLVDVQISERDRATRDRVRARAGRR